MNINKDNYEEFFLLFADNELADNEKNIVEDFVKQHPELQEEFLNINQSVLTPESDLKLDDKNQLFRASKKFINHANYNEAFILYNDNELTIAEKKETEAFLLENPSLINEFELLQKVKLQPDKSIVFPEKDFLLKKEDGAKVIPFKWWRAVAAAVFLGAVMLMGIKLQKKAKDDLPVIVKGTAPKKKSIGTIVIDTVSIQQVNIIGDKKAEKHSLKQKSVVKNNIDKLLPKARAVNEYQALQNQRQKNNLPQVNNTNTAIKKEVLNSIAKEEAKSNYDVPVDKIDDTDSKKIKQEDIANASENAVPGALAASYVSDENENRNNYVFYNVTEEKFSKSKIGSFLHKVKRIIERKISPLTNSKNQREVAVN